jgi:hypothetical protein
MVPDRLLAVAGRLLAVSSVLLPALGAQALAFTAESGRTAATTVISIPSTAIGVNTAVWDGNLTDHAALNFLRQPHLVMLRFPGGSTADVYHWRTNSITPGESSYAAPGNTFDRFMTQVVRPVHGQAMITVNYGTDTSGKAGGTPAEAAGWVHHANVVRHYGVRYWEIGNEVYGNGYYGADWEADRHADHSPAAYARNAVAFSRAMKAMDRSIKVGIVLVAPGTWPDGQGPKNWNSTVLRLACSAADFVSVHWYPQEPGKESDAGLLASVSAVPGMVAKTRELLKRYCGGHASGVQILVTETNSVTGQPGKQSVSPINALFLVEDYLSWLRAGVQSVIWWDLHNSATKGKSSAALNGTTTYGDYGLLSSGDGGEPPVDTPFPTATAFGLLSRIALPGATFVTLPAPPGGAFVTALRQRDGRIDVVAIDRSSHAQLQMHLGVGVMRAGTETLFGVAALHPLSRPVLIRNGGVQLTVPPYTMAVLALHR